MGTFLCHFTDDTFLIIAVYHSDHLLSETGFTTLLPGLLVVE
nr:MAG TPA: hypothetical protein [Caudoviricetes sp.]